MKKPAHNLLTAFLLLWLTGLTTACGGDDYHYPDILQEYLTAHSGADGRLQTVLTDDGTLYDVLNAVTAPDETPDTTLRIVANYACEEDGVGGQGVRLYAAQTTVSPLPLPADRFEDGIKTDPASVLSIWMGLDYLNIVLEVKAGGGDHTFHFVEDEVRWDETTARREVCLSLRYGRCGKPVRPLQPAQLRGRGRELCLRVYRAIVDLCRAMANHCNDACLRRIFSLFSWNIKRT